MILFQPGATLDTPDDVLSAEVWFANVSQKFTLLDGLKVAYRRNSSYNPHWKWLVLIKASYELWTWNLILGFNII